MIPAGKLAYEERRTRAIRDGVYLPPFERLSVEKQKKWAEDRTAWFIECRLKGWPLRAEDML